MNDFNKLKSGSTSPHTLHYLVWRFLPCLLVYYYYYYYYYYYIIIMIILPLIQL